MNKSKVDHLYEKFATLTVVRVFNFIRISSSLIERIFWIILLLGFTSLTALNIWQTVEKFISEPTTSWITFTNGFALTFPNVTVCTKIQSSSLIALYADEMNRTLDYFAKTPDINLYLKNKLWLVRNLFDAFTEVEYGNLLKQPARAIQALFSPEDHSLIGLTSAMLSSFVQREQKIEQSLEILDRLQNFYIAKNTNFGQLLRLTAQLYCVILQLTVLRSAYNADIGSVEGYAYDICGIRSNPALKFFGYLESINLEGLCLQFPINSKPLIFTNIQDMLYIRVYPTALYKEYAGSVGDIAVDFSGLLALEQQPPIISFSGNFDQLILFELQVVSTALDLRRRPCANIRTRKMNNFECKLWCRAELIRNACGCKALLNEFVPESIGGELPYCEKIASSAYLNDEKCFQTLARTRFENSTHACSNPCYPNCETIVLTSTIKFTSQTNATSGMFVMFQPQKFIYQRIDESEAMDWKVFISAIGGNLSLYLGASFLALIHIVVFLIKLPFECKREKDKPVVESENNTKDRFTSKQYNEMQLRVQALEVCIADQLMGQYDEIQLRMQAMEELIENRDIKKKETKY